jgi:hypothetical protein
MFCAPEHVFSGAKCVWSRFHILHIGTSFRRYRGSRFQFSCFACPDSFSAVPRASGAIFIFCAPELILDGTEGVGSRFHVLLAQTRFRRYQGRRVPFSYFALPDSFSEDPRASGPVLIFCSPGLVFGGIEGVSSHLHVLRSYTSFRRCRLLRVPFSCFAHPDSFSAVPRSSYSVFMFSAPGHVFGGAEGVGSHFYVLRSRTRLRRYQGCLVPYSCFACPDSFSAELMASTLVFLF